MKTVFILLLLYVTVLAKTETIVLGAGCFWGVEKYFEHLKGVVDATVGYAGGEEKNPSYESVLKRRFQKGVKNHAEVVRVVYEDTEISTKEILEKFWELHDPTQKDAQGNDIGNNYRSIILYTNKEQKEIALKTKKVYQELLTKAGYGTITTEIIPLEKFYKAEEYHQDYLKKNPYGYCPNHATGVKFAKEKNSLEKIQPLGGKEIVVIESQFCPFCRAFHKDVTDDYHAKLPLRSAFARQLEGFENLPKIVATPTILFVKDGRVQEYYLGYMPAREFYEKVASFVLGKESEAYKVAFAKETDGRFCKKYEKFAHTPEGVFVDTISGDILFDTKDRFHSGSGWLSFYRAVAGSVEEREDNSYGMHRIEIIAKKSGAHLGHKFHDAPGGRWRYCINASVLEFVPRKESEK